MWCWGSDWKLAKAAPGSINWALFCSPCRVWKQYKPLLVHFVLLSGSFQPSEVHWLTVLEVRKLSVEVSESGSACCLHDKRQKGQKESDLLRSWRQVLVQSGECTGNRPERWLPSSLACWASEFVGFSYRSMGERSPIGAQVTLW